jgi:hypothetical protein
MESRTECSSIAKVPIYNSRCPYLKKIQNKMRYAPDIDQKLNGLKYTIVFKVALFRPRLSIISAVTPNIP